MRASLRPSLSPVRTGDSGDVSLTVTAAEFASRPLGRYHGDTLRVTDTGMVYVWVEALERWVVPEMAALTCSSLATVRGDSAALGDEGWAVGGTNAGTTTTDGAKVTMEISGTNASIVEVWNLSTLPALTDVVYLSGYIGFGEPLFGQSVVQCLRGVDYFTLARNASISGSPTPIVVRGTTSIAFRQSEYASAPVDSDEHWWDIVLPEGGTSGQLRIYLDHKPWFGCAMLEVPGAASLNGLQVGCSSLNSGTRQASISLRDFHVITGAP